MTSEAQSHSGAVTTGTPKVQYAYTNGSANHARRTSITRPDNTAIDQLRQQWKRGGRAQPAQAIEIRLERACRLHLPGAGYARDRELLQPARRRADLPEAERRFRSDRRPQPGRRLLRPGPVRAGAGPEMAQGHQRPGTGSIRLRPRLEPGAGERMSSRAPDRTSSTPTTRFWMLLWIWP
jgi:hypothetical protein